MEKSVIFLGAEGRGEGREGTGDEEDGAGNY